MTLLPSSPFLDNPSFPTGPSLGNSNAGSFVLSALPSNLPSSSLPHVPGGLRYVPHGTSLVPIPQTEYVPSSSTFHDPSPSDHIQLNSSLVPIS